MESQKRQFKVLINKKTELYCNFHIEDGDVLIHESSYPELWGKYVFLDDIISYIDKKAPGHKIDWVLFKSKFQLIEVNLCFSSN